jgi:hypothetical protein
VLIEVVGSEQESFDCVATVVQSDCGVAERRAPSMREQSPADPCGSPVTRHISQYMLIRSTRREGSVDEQRMTHVGSVAERRWRRPLMPRVGRRLVIR